MCRKATNNLVILRDEIVYTQVNLVPLNELHNRLEYICLSIQTLSKDEIKFILLKPNKGYRICTLYFLPKLHKTHVVSRPICSYSGFVFEHTSIWLHYKLYLILQQQKQHLEDSLSLVRDLEDLRRPTKCYSSLSMYNHCIRAFPLPRDYTLYAR